MKNKLLTAGIVAGPLYILIGLIEAFTREGFDITKHDLSLLSNGEYGWIHISLLIVTGLLVIAAAFGIRSALADGRGKTWGPILLGLYGLGLVGAGIFVADPMNGFPPGSSNTMNTVSTNAILHIVSGAIGFLGLIAACFVFARRFANYGQKGWFWFSLLTGILFFAAFFGIASGSTQTGAVLTGVIMFFWLAVIASWTWLSLFCVKLMKGAQALKA